MSYKFDNLLKRLWRTYFKSGVFELEMPYAHGSGALRGGRLFKLLPRLKDKRVSFIFLTRNNFTIATF